MITILRWLAVPAVVAAVALGSVMAANGYVASATRQCAAMAGNACVEGWHTATVERAILTALALAVLLAVLGASWLAPAGKRLVAIAVSLVGIGLPLTVWFYTGWQELRVPTGLAGLTALLACVLVWRRVGAHAGGDGV
ncbi:MAG: hypothetical protein AAGI15_12425 [Pseudomonadota bacterium]